MDQKIIMYCPPAYLTTSKSSKERFKLFDLVDTRFLCSPQYTSNTKSLQNALDRQGYALDNGAYLDYIKEQPFDDDRYIRFLHRYISGADWVVLPDVVCNKAETLQKSYRYIDIIRDIKADVKMLIVWQDGMTQEDIRPLLSMGIGVFVGGSTEGKLSNVNWIAEECRRYNVWCHVGRINTLIRLEKMYNAKVNSFDGSGIVRFLPTLKLLATRIKNERSQLHLFDNVTMSKELIRTWIKGEEQA